MIRNRNGKNMKKRKKQEPIVLDNRELMPTTLGSLKTKENGPIVVIILFLLFGACIYFLPDIISFLNPNKEVITPPVVIPPNNDEKPDEPNEDPIKYLDFSSSLTFKMDGFSFSNFAINNTTKILNFVLTRESGSSLYFKNRKVYLELYSSENKLLQRIKIPSEEISESKSFQEDIAEALSNGIIAKLSIREINAEDYPNVSLKTNSNKEGLLTCLKNQQKLIYYFTNENSEYRLNKIKESTSFLNSNTDYQNILTNYTTLSATYQNINGIISDLIPTTTGFQFDVTIDLNTISATALNRYFKEDYYYQRNTQAKVIAFELESLGYSCT